MRTLQLRPAVSEFTCKYSTCRLHASLVGLKGPLSECRLSWRTLPRSASLVGAQPPVNRVWVVARHAERGLEVRLVMRGRLGSAALASLNLGLAEGGQHLLAHRCVVLT